MCDSRPQAKSVGNMLPVVLAIQTHNHAETKSHAHKNTLPHTLAFTLATCARTYACSHTALWVQTRMIGLKWHGHEDKAK